MSPAFKSIKQGLRQAIAHAIAHAKAKAKANGTNKPTGMKVYLPIRPSAQ